LEKDVTYWPVAPVEVGAQLPIRPQKVEEQFL
jgi:hypothetical protein